MGRRNLNCVGKTDSLLRNLLAGNVENDESVIAKLCNGKTLTARREFDVLGPS